MTDNVNVELGDNKSKSAYDMAKFLWKGTHTQSFPTSEEEVTQFLNLVVKCERALRGISPKP